MNTQKSDLASELDNETFLTHHYALAEDLGLPRSFLLTLWDSEPDDWSFIIKLHALIEASLAHVLAAAVPGEEKVAGVFGKLSVLGQGGKVAFADAFGALERKHCRFLENFTRLRNMMVHDIHQVGFSLRDHVTKLAPKERDEFLRGLLYAADQANPEARLRLFEAHPRFVLWGHAMMLITHIFVFKATLSMNAEREAIFSRWAKEIFDLWGTSPGASFEQPTQAGPSASGS